METEEGGIVVKGRVTIDSRPPFRSVKEAVVLFGERVLVGEIYGKQLKEMEPKEATSDIRLNITSTIGAVSSELEETKKKLQQETEEGNYIATCLKSLKDELEETKRELMHLKTAKNESMVEQPKMINPEIEELNFVEHSTSKPDFDNGCGICQYENQKKRFVTFASPPSLTREMMHENADNGSSARLGRTPSIRKGSNNEGKKKPISPIIGWLFPRKKNFFEGVSN